MNSELLEELAIKLQTISDFDVFVLEYCSSGSGNFHIQTILDRIMARATNGGSDNGYNIIDFGTNDDVHASAAKQRENYSPQTKLQKMSDIEFDREFEGDGE